MYLHILKDLIDPKTGIRVVISGHSHKPWSKNTTVSYFLIQVAQDYEDLASNHASPSASQRYSNPGSNC